MNDVTARCEKCRSEIGKAIGEDFHSKAATQGFGRMVTLAPPQVPLTMMAGWRGESTVYYACTIGLVAVQLGLGWPWGPPRKTTTTQTLDRDGRVIERTTTSEADGGAAREALFRAVAGIAALAAGLLAWGRLELSRGQHGLDRKAAERDVEAQHLATRAQEATERGQVTARFTTAVEQLGHTDPSVRLGALYALEALAHDSEGDRLAIAEVVCAYARHHSTRRLLDGTPELIEAGDGHPVEARVEGRAVDYQAAITIALRLPADWSLPIRNLRGTIVADLDLGSIGLTGHRLGAVDFTAATFTGGVRFSGATFTGGARFDAATFTGGARFDAATFTGEARFSGATFTGDALFDGATFAGDAPFWGATFTGDASFDEANFDHYAYFVNASFGRAGRFVRATFTGRAQFDGATFDDHTRFDGATFTGGARFYAANVKKSLSLPPGVDPGPQFRPDPADPTKWYRREGEAPLPSTTGVGA